jgi:hypothetical protein
MIIDWIGSGDPLDPVNIGISVETNDFGLDLLGQNNTRSSSFSSVDRPPDAVEVKKVLNGIADDLKEWGKYESVPLEVVYKRYSAVLNYHEFITVMLKYESERWEHPKLWGTGMSWWHRGWANELRKNCKRLKRGLSHRIQVLEAERKVEAKERSARFERDKATLCLVTNHISEYTKRNTHNAHDLENTRVFLSVFRDGKEDASIRKAATDYIVKYESIIDMLVAEAVVDEEREMKEFWAMVHGADEKCDEPYYDRDDYEEHDRSMDYDYGEWN